MITKVGQSVLDELSSELNESIEDQKNQIILEQGGSILKSLLLITDEYIRILFVTTLIAFLVPILFIDEQTVKLMIEATPKDIVNTINNILQLSIVASICFSFIWFLIRRKKAFHDIKQEVKSNCDNELKNTQNTIELIEEVLHRHQLIKKVK